MFASETFIFATSATYAARLNLPVMTYLESWVILVQVAVICLLMFYYKKQTFSMLFYAVATAAFVVSMLYVLPMSVVGIAFSSIIPMLLYGRAPQIWSNFQNKDTGALSLVSLIMSFGGGLARIFTTLQEAPSTLILAGLLSGVVLNGILIAQILMYAKKGGSKKARKSGTKKEN